MMTIQAINASPRRGNRLASPAGALWGRVNQWRKRARQRRDLLELDARQLRDIGLSRVDVVTECSKPFWRA
jgi:uncharacterized protein YjiS (DUF1127 family)